MPDIVGRLWYTIFFCHNKSCHQLAKNESLSTCKRNTSRWVFSQISPRPSTAISVCVSGFTGTNSAFLWVLRNALKEWNWIMNTLFGFGNVRKWIWNLRESLLRIMLIILVKLGNKSCKSIFWFLLYSGTEPRVKNSYCLLLSENCREIPTKFHYN